MAASRNLENTSPDAAAATVPPEQLTKRALERQPSASKGKLRGTDADAQQIETLRNLYKSLQEEHGKQLAALQEKLQTAEARSKELQAMLDEQARDLEAARAANDESEANLRQTSSVLQNKNDELQSAVSAQQALQKTVNDLQRAIKEAQHSQQEEAERIEAETEAKLNGEFFVESLSAAIQKLQDLQTLPNKKDGEDEVGQEAEAAEEEKGKFIKQLSELKEALKNEILAGIDTGKINDEATAEVDNNKQGKATLALRNDTEAMVKALCDTFSNEKLDSQKKLADAEGYIKAYIDTYQKEIPKISGWKKFATYIGAIAKTALSWLLWLTLALLPAGLTALIAPEKGTVEKAAKFVDVWQDATYKPRFQNWSNKTAMGARAFATMFAPSPAPAPEPAANLEQHAASASVAHSS